MVVANPVINFQGVFKIGDTANFIPYHHFNQIEIERKTEKKKEKRDQTADAVNVLLHD